MPQRPGLGVAGGGLLRQRDRQRPAFCEGEHPEVGLGVVQGEIFEGLERGGGLGGAQGAAGEGVGAESCRLRDVMG